MTSAKPPRRRGTGGHGRKALEGKGPTPRAEDRHWYSDKKRPKPSGSARPASGGKRETATADVVCGRNPVVEALRTKTPATQLTIALRIERDQRVDEALALAQRRNIPVVEMTKPELDRLAGQDVVHQGIVLTVPPYRYADPFDLADRALEAGNGVLVALDGVTDPRNLGAIVRSVAAFGGFGVIVPSRRSVGVTPVVWRTSAGQLGNAPVALAGNLTQTLKALQQRGFHVVGLAGDQANRIEKTDLAGVPVVVVVGGEGAGLSRLVRDTCDDVVAIPIDPRTESLNASVACGIALYEIARQRALP